MMQGVKHMLLRHVYLNSLEGKASLCTASFPFSRNKIGDKGAKHVCVRLCMCVCHIPESLDSKEGLCGG